MNITDALVAEHRTLSGLFNQIERMLPALTSVQEVGRLASLVEGVLRDHAEAEANLAYLALDHVLAEKAQLESMHQDHREIDASLKRAQGAADCATAVRFLRSALKASRDHFRGEESTVFPLLERVLQPDTLAHLGTFWLERRSWSWGKDPIVAPAAS